MSDLRDPMKMTLQRLEIRLVRDGLDYKVSENDDELVISFGHAVSADFNLPPIGKYGDEQADHRKDMIVVVRNPDHETAIQKTDGEAQGGAGRPGLHRADASRSPEDVWERVSV